MYYNSSFDAFVMSLPTIVILSGPSAVGKTTIADILLKCNKNFARIITCTSREPRSNETNYIFLSKKEFKEKIKKNCFIEYSKVYKNYYGILQSEFEKAYKQFTYSLIVIDTVGSLKLIKYCKQNKITYKSIFLTLRDKEQIKERLLAREKQENQFATDKKANIKKRIEAMTKELQTAQFFDKQIYNQDLQTCVLEIQKFITATNSNKNQIKT